MSLLWGAVAAYIIYAAVTARAYRAQLTVSSIVIDVADSSSQGHLVSSPQVREWLRRSGLRTVGSPVKEIDLEGIEKLIARNGFVDKVDAYVSYDGRLRIDIRQRRPMMRLLVNGMDSYVTSDGYVFPAPRASSLYVPVVTGSYRPPFAASYAGSVLSHIAAEKQQIEERIAKIDKEKYPFYRRERENDENFRALRRMRIKKGWFEKDEHFAKRVAELREKKDRLRGRYRYEERMIEAGIARVAQKQVDEGRKQKKLDKNYEDFSKLITFVKFVDDDDFWRSEVVQIIASTSVSGALEVELIPRSGNHVIRFGRVENVEQKFDKLLRFYKNGLSNIGWNHYRTVDVRYEGQIVCKK